MEQLGYLFRKSVGMQKDIRHDRRQHLRVRYPEDDCPSAIIDGRTLPLVEISHCGIILKASPEQLVPRQSIEAILLFHDGTSLQVVGKVIRLSDGKVVIHLTYGIPEFRILLERQYLGQRLLTHNRPRPERRKHPRIRYTDMESPYLIIGVIAFPVIEMSEGAVVFQDQHNRFRLRQEITGALLFQDGTYVNIEGTIMRVGNQRLVIRLTFQLPKEHLYTGRHKKMASEQRVVIPERRKSPRVRYASEGGPYLQIQQLKYQVVEISTHGVVLQTDDARMSKDRVILANLRYPCSTQFLVHGTVIRKMRSFVVIELCIEIPEAWVKSEYQRLGGRTDHTPAIPAPEDMLSLMGIDMKSLRQ